MDDKDYASKGVAGAGLGLGIAGTALGLLAGGLSHGRGTNLLGTTADEVTVDRYCQSFEGRISQLESELARVNAERYADSVGIEVYKATVNNYKELDAKINENFGKLYGFAINIDKNTALNAQALDYENRLTNAKIDCCCNTVNTVMGYNKQIQELADASIISYVNSTFLPGQLRLPITSVCPVPATACSCSN